MSSDLSDSDSNIHRALLWNTAAAKTIQVDRGHVSQNALHLLLIKILQQSVELKLSCSYLLQSANVSNCFCAAAVMIMRLRLCLLFSVSLKNQICVQWAWDADENTNSWIDVRQAVVSLPCFLCLCPAHSAALSSFQVFFFFYCFTFLSLSLSSRSEYFGCPDQEEL